MHNNQNKHNNEAKIEQRRKYLIDQRLPRWTIIFQVLATFLCWLILLYCFRGIFFDAYNYFSGRAATMNFPRNILESFLVYAAAAAIIITIWVVYNQMMYGGRDRRKGFPVPTDEMQAEQYGISIGEMLVLRKARNIEVGFSEENRINCIDEKC